MKVQSAKASIGSFVGSSGAHTKVLHCLELLSHEPPPHKPNGPSFGSRFAHHFTCWWSDPPRELACSFHCRSSASIYFHCRMRKVNSVQAFFQSGVQVQAEARRFACGGLVADGRGLNGSLLRSVPVGARDDSCFHAGPVEADVVFGFVRCGCGAEVVFDAVLLMLLAHRNPSS